MADLTVSSDVDTFMAAANAAAMRSALGVGTIATQAASSVAITGGTLAGLTGLAIRSTGAAFDLTFATSEVLTGGRTLSFVLGDANRTLTIPATGTAALLGTANVFTASQRISNGSDYNLHTGIASQWYINSTGFVAELNTVAVSNGARFSLGALGQITWQSTNRTDSGSIDLLLVRKAAATLQLGLDAAGVTNQMLTAASRITSDGVGANLTIAGGNGRGGAGGSLILSTYDTASTGVIGTLRTRLTLDTAGLLTFADAVDMAFNATTGTKIGTATTQKIGFWNATPVVQQILATGGGATVDNVISLLQTLGLCKQS